MILPPRPRKAALPSVAVILRSSSRLVLVGVLLCVGSIYFLPTKAIRGWVDRVSILPIERLRIEADWPLDEGRVRAALPGVLGKSLFAVDPSQVAQPVLALPWADQVTVRREFPDALRVRVRTKRAAALTIDRGRPYFLDEAGGSIALATAEQLAAIDIPVLRIASALERRWDRARLVSALESTRRAVEPLGRLSELVADRPPWIFLYLSSPRWEVILSADDLEEQLSRLQRLLEVWSSVEKNSFADASCAQTAQHCGYRVSLLVRGRAVVTPMRLHPFPKAPAAPRRVATLPLPIVR